MKSMKELEDAHVKDMRYNRGGLESEIRQDFLAGAAARQPEVDALVAEVGRLKTSLATMLVMGRIKYGNLDPGFNHVAGIADELLEQVKP